MDTKLRVMIITEKYGSSLFGVAKVLTQMAEYYRKAGFSNVILVVDAKDISYEDEINLIKIPVIRFLGKICWHPIQEHWFSAQIKQLSPDLIHVHGVFTYIQKNVIKAANKKNIPILLSPHGMLEPWLWNQKGPIYNWLKRFYWGKLLWPVLKRVDFVHAITEQEAETLKKVFPNIPQFRIPNAIDLKEFSEKQEEPSEEKYFLFLGRLHPVKGVDLLLQAFARSNIGNIKLIIAGPDFNVAYSRKLRSMVSDLNLNDRVSFIGPVYGKYKEKLLRKAWCTIVPSYSEVISLVNLESAASYTPTITTYQCGLSNWEDGGGILVEPESKQISNAIEKIHKWSLEERILAGKMARKFIEQHYSWDVVGEQWIKAYNMIVRCKNKN